MRTGVLTMLLVLPMTFAVAGDGAIARPSIVLLRRHADARSSRCGCTYVGGGTINVRQPAPDTIVVTMVGAVVATAHPFGSSALLDFDLDQDFEINSGGCRTNLSLEAEQIGLLRGGRTAAARTSAAAVVTIGAVAAVAGNLPDRSVACGMHLAVNDRVAPDDVAVPPGVFSLHVRWRLAATHPQGLRGKAASAEFAPEPALGPIWVGGPRDPFHGVAKKALGLRIALKAAPAAAPARP